MQARECRERIYPFRKAECINAFPTEPPVGTIHESPVCCKYWCVCRGGSPPLWGGGTACGGRGFSLPKSPKAIPFREGLRWERRQRRMQRPEQWAAVGRCQGACRRRQMPGTATRIISLPYKRGGKNLGEGTQALPYGMVLFCFSLRLPRACGPRNDNKVLTSFS